MDNPSLEFVSGDRSLFPFRFQCYLELVEALSRCEDCDKCKEKILFLLGFCPQVEEREPLSSQQRSDDRFILTDKSTSSDITLLYVENQEAALSLGYYILLNQRTEYFEKILNSLCFILEKLDQCKWENHAWIKPEFFSYNLISLLREIVLKIPSTKGRIARSLCICVEKVVSRLGQYQEKYFNISRNFNGMIYGMCKSLGEKDGVQPFGIRVFQPLFTFVRSLMDETLEIPKKHKSEDLEPSKRIFIVDVNVYCLQVVYELIKLLSYFIDNHQENPNRPTKKKKKKLSQRMSLSLQEPSLQIIEKELSQTHGVKMRPKEFLTFCFNELGLKRTYLENLNNLIHVKLSSVAIQVANISALKLYQYYQQTGPFERITGLLDVVLSQHVSTNENYLIEFYLDVVRSMERLHCQTFQYKKCVDLYTNLLNDDDDVHEEQQRRPTSKLLTHVDDEQKKKIRKNEMNEQINDGIVESITNVLYESTKLYGVKLLGSTVKSFIIKKKSYVLHRIFKKLSQSGLLKPPQKEEEEEEEEEEEVGNDEEEEILLEKEKLEEVNKHIMDHLSEEITRRSLMGTLEKKILRYFAESTPYLSDIEESRSKVDFIFSLYRPRIRVVDVRKLQGGDKVKKKVEEEEEEEEEGEGSSDDEEEGGKKMEGSSSSSEGSESSSGEEEESSSSDEEESTEETSSEEEEEEEEEIEQQLKKQRTAKPGKKMGLGISSLDGNDEDDELVTTFGDGKDEESSQQSSQSRREARSILKGEIFEDYLLVLITKTKGAGNFDLLEYILIKLYDLFNRLCGDIIFSTKTTKTTSGKKSSSGGTNVSFKRLRELNFRNVSILLNPISQCMTIITNNQRRNKESINFNEFSEAEETMSSNYDRFRKLWFYCVLFNFVEENQYEEDHSIIDACTRIASVSPYLVNRNSKYNFHDVEAIISSIVNKGRTGRAGTGQSEFEKQNIKEYRSRFLVCVPKITDRNMDLFPPQSNNNNNNMTKKRLQKNLSFAELIYLLSVYHLETLRVMSTFSLMFIPTYLADTSLVDQEVMCSALSLIIGQAFEQWMENVAMNDQYDVVEKETCELIRFLPSSYHEVREDIYRKLIRVSKKFSFLFWSDLCLKTLLDLLQKIYETTQQGNLFQTSVQPIFLGDDERNNMMLVLPQLVEDRKVLYQHCHKLVVDWIKYGLSIAPGQVKESLMKYFLGFKTGYFQHVGYTMAILLTMPNNINFRARPYPTVTDSLLSSKMEKSEIIERYKLKQEKMSKRGRNRRRRRRRRRKGTVSDEMYLETDESKYKKSAEMLNLMTSDSSFQFYSVSESLSTRQHYLGQLQYFLQMMELQEKRIEDYFVGVFSSIDHTDISEPAEKKIDSSLKLLTSYMIHCLGNNDGVKNTNIIPVKLLQWLIWTPVLRFTESSMKTGIFCWNWLLSSLSNQLLIDDHQQEVNISFLTEMCYAWDYCIEKKKGIFRGAEKDTELAKILIPREVGDAEDLKSYDRKKQDEMSKDEKEFEPHRLWINFLADMTSRAISMRRRYTHLIIRLILRSLHRYEETLSLHPASFSCRVRLCFVGLVLARHVSDDHLSPLLRDRIYRCGLQWFEHPPVWWGPGQDRRFWEDDAVYVEFESILRREKIEYRMSQQQQQKEEQDGDGEMNNNSKRSVEFSDVDSTRSRRRIRLKSTFGGITDDGKETSTRSHVSTCSSVTSYPSGSFSRVMNMISVFRMMIKHEIFRLRLWHEPRKSKEIVEAMGMTNNQYFSKEEEEWKSLQKRTWNFCPSLCLSMFSYRLIPRMDKKMSVVAAVVEDGFEKLVGKDWKEVVGVPEALKYIIILKKKKKKKILKNLYQFDRPRVTRALKYLNHPYVLNPYVREYALQSLVSISPQELEIFIPQFVQLVQHDESGRLKKLLIENVCKKSAIFTHQLIWQLRNEIVGGVEAMEKKMYGYYMDEDKLKRKYKKFEEHEEKEVFDDVGDGDIISKTTTTTTTPKYEKNNNMSKSCYLFLRQILASFSPRQQDLYDQQVKFFDQMTQVSESMMPYHGKDKKLQHDKLNEFLGKIKVPPFVYLPASPDYRILSIVPGKGITLKSAKKVPIMVSFETQKRKGIRMDSDERQNDNPIVTQRLIFKSGDDCRMDQIALQGIELIRRIYAADHLPFFLYPYKVIPTAHGDGIIEVVVNSKSIHDLKEEVDPDTSLKQCFLKEYGDQKSLSYQNARKNYMESMAPYCIVTYIFSVVDRHNGNIMINNLGHVIHIDFGFIFNFGPGGGFAIEKLVPFKFTREMAEIIVDDEHSGSGSSYRPRFINLNEEVDDDDNNNNNNKQTQLKNVKANEKYLAFLDLLIRGYLKVCTNSFSEEILDVVEILSQSDLDCFTKMRGPKGCLKNLKDRMMVNKKEEEKVSRMIWCLAKSDKNVLSNVYDWFQWTVTGINL